MTKNSLTYTVIFTFLTAFFFVFFLALADGATAELVRQNQLKDVQRAILATLDLLPADEETVPEVYAEEFDRIPAPGELLEAVREGEPVLVKYYTGAGLWGTITGILAVDQEVSRIVGMEIITHNETPGLGGRIDEAWFKEQFRGEVLNNRTITVRKSGGGDLDSSNGIVDGITGASLTSKSIETILNYELNELAGGN